MATPMQLEVILAGNRKVTRVSWSRDSLRVNKDECEYEYARFARQESVNQN